MSLDSDSYSSSGSDDERRKSHQTSRRKVRNSSQREVFSSDWRDTRNNRKPGHESKLKKKMYETFCPPHRGQSPIVVIG